jgi:hypothetical protein
MRTPWQNAGVQLGADKRTRLKPAKITPPRLLPERAETKYRHHGLAVPLRVTFGHRRALKRADAHALRVLRGTSPPFSSGKWGGWEGAGMRIAMKKSNRSTPEMGGGGILPPVVPPFQYQKWGDEEVCPPTMDGLLGVVRLGVSQFRRSMHRSTAAGRG